MIAQNKTYKTYLLIALGIFFFDHFMIFSVLQLATVLSPFFLFFLIRNKRIKWWAVSSFILGIWTMAHIAQGVNLQYTLISFLMAESILIFIFFFIEYYRYVSDLDKVLDFIVKCNMVFLLLAFLAYPVSVLRKTFWFYNELEIENEKIPRLKMFELEASHYSLLIAPLLIYYFWKLVKQFNKKDLVFFASLLVSLAFSFSLGVIAALAIAFVLFFLLRWQKIYQHARIKYTFLGMILLGIFSLAALYLLYPDNFLFQRLKNVVTGMDTSGRGRTYEAFILANKIVQQKNSILGIGLGQLKELGRDTIVQYYHYTKIPETIRLPNSSAEMIVYFGYFGFLLKVGLAIFLFFKFRVYADTFRLSLYLFIFIYQFTGSYIFNITEYMIWIAAVIPKDFNLKFKDF